MTDQNYCFESIDSRVDACHGCPGLERSLDSTLPRRKSLLEAINLHILSFQKKRKRRRNMVNKTCLELPQELVL